MSDRLDNSPDSLDRSIAEWCTVSDADRTAARAVPILTVWRRLGLPEVAEGKAFCSPFRPDKHPSAQLGGVKNIFYDHAANKTLDTIGLVREVKGCTYREAVSFVLNGHAMAPTARPKPIMPKAPSAPLVRARPASRTVFSGENETIAFLCAVFDPGEFVNVTAADMNGKPTNKGQTLTREEWIAKADACGSLDKALDCTRGIFVCVNPLLDSGKGRTTENIAVFRHTLIEFDDLPLEEQQRRLEASGLPITSLASSGNKSLHALVRIDAADAEDYAATVKEVYAVNKGCDPVNKNASRVSRLPGCQRGETRQELLALHIGAESLAAWRAGMAPAPLADAPDVAEIPAPDMAGEGDTPGKKILASLKIVRASDLEGMTFPKTRWAVESFLPEGLAVLAGKPKRGKSWTMLGVAVDVALGRPALGHFGTPGGEVLYMSLEDSESRVQSRLAQILQGAPFPERLHVVWNWPRLEKGGLETLDEWFCQHPTTVLVVLDTFTRLRPPRRRGEDPYQADADLTGIVQRLALKHHACIVAIMHQRKMGSDDVFDTVSGTLGMTASADVIAVFERKPKAQEAFLHLTGRDVEEAKWALRLDGSLWRWDHAVEDDGEEDALEPAKTFLRQALADGPVESKKLFGWGVEAGFDKRALFAAKKAMPTIKARKSGFTGGWTWDLPTFPRAGVSV